MNNHQPQPQPQEVQPQRGEPQRGEPDFNEIYSRLFIDNVNFMVDLTAKAYFVLEDYVGEHRASVLAPIILKDIIQNAEDSTRKQLTDLQREWTPGSSQ
jgi:hypothetical protein